MKLCCTYIETDKFDEVVNFYEQLLKIKGNIYTPNRWIEFNVGNKLAIYNKQYDIEKITKNNTTSSYNNTFIENFNLTKEKSINNTITLNFYTDNLKAEYERIKTLNIGKISKIMYVNITEPYYYFNLIDPVGNTLEICGETL